MSFPGVRLEWGVLRHNCEPRSKSTYPCVMSQLDLGKVGVSSCRHYSQNAAPIARASTCTKAGFTVAPPRGASVHYRAAFLQRRPAWRVYVELCFIAHLSAVNRLLVHHAASHPDNLYCVIAPARGEYEKETPDVSQSEAEWWKRGSNRKWGWCKSGLFTPRYNGARGGMRHSETKIQETTWYVGRGLHWLW